MKRLKQLFRRKAIPKQVNEPAEQEKENPGTPRKTPVFKEEEGKCRNCGSPLASKYGPECGQTADVKRLTFRTWIDNIFKAFLDFDGTLIRTFRMLFTRPGRMINEYIAGQRKDYRNPFTLLIILCTIYGIILFTGKIVEAYKEAKEKELARKEVLTPEEPVQATDSVRIAGGPLGDLGSEALPDGLTERTDKHIEQQLSSLNGDTAATNLSSSKKNKEKKDKKHKKQKSNNPIDRLRDSSIRLAKDNESSLRSMGMLLSSLTDSLIFRSVLMIPFYALFTKLFFYRKTRRIYNYTELLFANAYISCQKVIIDTLLFPIEKYAHVDTGWFLFLFYLFFPAWTYKGLFRVKWWGAIWRCSLIYLFSFIVLFFVAILALILVGIVFVNDNNAPEFVDMILEVTGVD
ncbi:MAG: DUF3667 domain-containing protein [Bacteroides sp.]|nr:DUF3667 domain-containing protein [Bacteroides sp.]